MKHRPCNVLFLCTANSARSIMAESLLNATGKGRFRAYSAGSMPGEGPHPLAFDTLRRLDLPTDGLRSKSWEEFAQADAPAMDLIITVCDNAAGEVCPVWPGRPTTAHWSIEDPSTSTGDEDRKRQSFSAAAALLKRRIELLVALPVETLDRSALAQKVRAIAAQ